MLKWIFECRNCGATTSEKTSGSIAPKNWKREVPEDIMCYYCNTRMEAIDCFDSSAFMFVCRSPYKNLKSLVKK